MTNLTAWVILLSMMNTTNVYLVTPNHLLSSFIDPRDRVYFSKPVLVELLYSERSTKQLYVRDPNRGHTYPTNPKYLVAPWRLTNKQKREVA